MVTLKIGIYLTGAKKRREAIKMISGYIDELGIKSEISQIKDYSSALKYILNPYIPYNIMIICMNDEAKIVVERYFFHLKNQRTLAVKDVKYPLSKEIIDDALEILMGDTISSGCPKGKFTIVTKKTALNVDHENIEYFFRENKKTVVCLSDGSCKILNESLLSIKKKLPEEYFIHMPKGCVINLYNIKCSDRSTHTFTTKCGRKISVSKNLFKKMNNKFLKIVFNL